LILRQKQGAFVNPPVLQPFEYFPTSHAILQEFFSSTLFIAPVELLTKRRTLECSQTDVKTERHKSIKHALCKWNSDIPLNASLKALQIGSKYGIYLLHTEDSEILNLYVESVPLVNGQLALFRVKNVANPYSPEFGWTSVRLLSYTLMVFDHCHGFG
jgi:hypothetical protein